MRDEASERGAVGEENREVIESEAPARRHGLRALEVMQHDDRRGISLRAEHGLRVSLVQGAQPDHFAIVHARAREVGHLEMDSPELCLRVKAVSCRRDRVGELALATH